MPNLQEATDDDNTEEDEPLQNEASTTVSASSPDPAGDHTLDSLLSRGTLDPQPSTSHNCTVSASSEPLPYTIRNGGGERDVREFMRPNIESAIPRREPQLTHNISHTNIPSHGTNEGTNDLNVSSNTGSDDNSCPIAMETATIVNTDAQNQGTDVEMETTDNDAVTEGTGEAQVVLPPDGSGTANNTVTTRDVADSEFLNEID